MMKKSIGIGFVGGGFIIYVLKIRANFSHLPSSQP